MSFYKPDHFELYELVPETVYKSVSHVKLWQCFDQRLLWTQEQFRLRYGKMVCNTWWWGGRSQYRGYRTFDCEEGAEWSQHKFFGAIDSVLVEYDLGRVWEDIMEAKRLPREEQGIYRHITCIEMGKKVTWLHYDTRNWNGLLIVRP